MTKKSEKLLGERMRTASKRMWLFPKQIQVNNSAEMLSERKMNINKLEFPD